jgi:beta-hydroxylase
MPLPKQLRRIHKRAVRLPLKRLGHAIENWVANQSPLGNVPVVDSKAFEWVGRLEENSQLIRRELVALLSSQEALPSIQDISPRQYDLSKGSNGWKSYFFCLLGHRFDESYRLCPETGKLLDSIPDLQLAFFSILEPGMHIKRHRGSYKGVIRCHLGLIVPQPWKDVRMTVGDALVHWEEGKCVIFDDTYHHEVWNETDGARAVLLLDVCRPLPAWLARMNRALLGFASYWPEILQAVQNQRAWQAKTAQGMPEMTVKRLASQVDR